MWTFYWVSVIVCLVITYWYLCFDDYDGVPTYISKHFPSGDYTPKTKKESLVAAYYKGFKDKYCPVFELEESDE